MSLTFGPFRVIPGKRLLLRSNQPVRLPSRAHEILLVLLERSGQLVPRSELIERVSDGARIGESQLRVYVSKLRRALEDDRKELRYVENVSGHGYRFIAPVTAMSTTDDNPVRTGASFEFGPFELIPDRRLLLRAGSPVNVPSRAWEILLALIESAGDLVGKADLLARVWPRVVVEEGTLRVHISGLRRILGDRKDGVHYIENVTGLGYRFAVAVRKRDREEASDPSCLPGRRQVTPTPAPVPEPGHRGFPGDAVVA
jgi:DNA-binding winged helix-turn-helix (wHTH) protein